MEKTYMRMHEGEAYDEYITCKLIETKEDNPPLTNHMEETLPLIDQAKYILQL